MIKYRRQQNGGYTLAEMLVYIAILTFALVSIIQAMLLLTTSYKNIKAVRSIESSALTAVGRIETDIRSATSIDSANSSFNVNPGVLKLNIGTSTVRFYVSNQRLYVEENGVNAGPLTLSNVDVSSLVFRSISATNSQAVKIELILQASSTSVVTKKFYMTTVLRGSYQ